MPKVSVITPAYNAEKYLKQTIKSVQKQTFSDWEMIISDDCSTDDTVRIAEEMAEKDQRIIVVKNKYNLGVASTRNSAIEKANGQYIAFVDSDDLWLPHKLEEQLEFMEENKYVLTYTNYKKFISETNEILPKIIRAPKFMTAEKIYGDTSIGCLTVMVNRDLSGPFHMPVIDHTEDNITWQRILSKGFIAYRLDKVLALYRENNNSMTSNKKKAAIQQWNTYRKFYGFSVPKSAFYFSSYTVNAVKKHFL